jgi:DNA invertase Pin-like site-specific DNA recombinase
MKTVTLISPQTKQAVTKLRVAAYCRVSSNSADQQNSYANQVRIYTDMVKRKKEWELVEIFADEGITGTSASKRPEFMRMIKACELHEIDLIITKSISRFARNVKESLEYVRKLKLMNVAVLFEKEGINTLTLGDEMLINTFSAIAQEESVSISQNLKLANRKRMARGEYINASAPYGFTFEDKTLIPYEPEAQYVRQIYEWYLNGLSTDEIADRLTTMGVLTKRGKETWKDTRVASLLANVKNVGDTLFQKTCNIGFPFTKIKNRGEEDQYYATDTHIGIVDRATFDAVQKLLRKRQTVNARKTEITQYPLTGKIKCEECGSYYRRRIVRGRVRWGCANHIEDSSKCNTHYLSQEQIYDGFVAIVNKLRFGCCNIIDQVERNIEYALYIMKRQNADAMQIQQEINTLNAKQLMLEQLRSKGYLAPEIYQQQSQQITAQMTKLKNNQQNAYKTTLEDELHQIRIIKQRLSEIEKPLTFFEETLYTEIVTSMALTKEEKLTITFLGGISFSEIL